MREASANTGSLLSVIGVMVVSDSRYRRLTSQPVGIGPFASLPAAQDSSDFESLFDTVDQRLRFERLSEQACCAVCCRLIVDA